MKYIFSLGYKKLDPQINWLEQRMGGAFLSQPITTKNTKIYQHNKIRVVTSEMQGRVIV